jgi:putative glutamine amidotransferase
MIVGATRVPRIGLTTYLEEARWGVWHTTAALLPASYVSSVAAGGGAPMLLPPASGSPTDVLAAVDALVLTGGCDVDPRRYGMSPHPLTTEPQGARDEWELSLARAAHSGNVPILAVCRGMQVLNVCLGGTLTQHLPEQVGHQRHAPAPGVFGVHQVLLDEGSRLGGLLGRVLDVPTHHHQAVDTLGHGLVPVGWADDGTVEAVEAAGHPFAVGVQWHPEVGEDLRLFTALAERGAARSTGDVTPVRDEGFDHETRGFEDVDRG